MSSTVASRTSTASAVAASDAPDVEQVVDLVGVEHAGSDDHVAQYSIPIGTVMYRLVCIAPTAMIEKYRPLFSTVAASFKLIKAAPSAP